MSSGTRIPLALARNLAQEFAKKLEPYCDRIEIVGSIRRHKMDIGDIDILTIPKSIPDLDKFLEKALSPLISGIGGTWQVIGDYKTVRFNILKSKETSWGAALLHSTGSEGFNTILRAKAKSKGYLLNQHGIWMKGLFIAGENEEQVFDILGLAYVEPPFRNTDNIRNTLNKTSYKIQSHTDPDAYYEVKTDTGALWTCACKHNTFRGLECKHISEARAMFSQEGFKG